MLAVRRVCPRNWLSRRNKAPCPALLSGECLQRRPVMRTAFYAAAAIAAATAFLPRPAIGQAGDSAQEKVTRVVVYGRDPCPRGSEDEIIVCARRPETERYRIPEELREPSDHPDNESWAAK